MPPFISIELQLPLRPLDLHTPGHTPIHSLRSRSSCGDCVEQCSGMQLLVYFERERRTGGLGFSVHCNIYVQIQTSVQRNRSVQFDSLFAVQARLSKEETRSLTRATVAFLNRKKP